MATVSNKTPANSYFHVDLRRHSSAHPERMTTPTSRKGSADATKSPPAWMSSIQDRDRQGSTKFTPETHSSGLKGLFGRRKSSSAESKKPEQIIVVGSKYSGQAKNVLKADPRGARKYPSPSQVQAPHTGTLPSTTVHTTAAEQEMRHPHSGPPTLQHAESLPMLTRIMSGDERDDEDHILEKARTEWDSTKKMPDFEKVVENQGAEEEETGVGVGGVEDLRQRRKSLLDVEMKAGEGTKPARQRQMFGAFRRNSNGIWTR